MLAAVAAGAEVLRAGGSALDAVVATVRALEDHPLFNAGVGSLLTVEGTVEMDASVMVALPPPPRPRRGAASAAARRARARAPLGPRRRAELRAGAVAVITRVRNPILLARAVMELTPHVLMAGAGAERLARRAGIALCRPEELVTPRARERWRAALERRAEAAGTAAAGGGPGRFGTVGAVALDAAGRTRRGDFDRRSQRQAARARRRLGHNRRRDLRRRAPARPPRRGRARPS